MKRSIGVTLSAVVVFIGCAMTLLGGVLMVVGIEFAQDQALANPLMRGVLIFEVLLDLGFVSWGLASGIGLLKLRGWARMSMIVFSGIMIAFCVIPMIIFPFIPIPQPDDTTANLGLIIRGGMEVFYGSFVALGAFWIYFFNKKSVKEQFRSGAEAATATIAPQIHVASAFASPSVSAARGQRKPVLITIIGVLLIASCASMPFALIMHAPALFFGFELHGVGAAIALATFCAFGLAAGIGLVRFRLWGWITALLFYVVGIANTASFLLIPGALDRFNSAIEQQYAAWAIPQSALPYSLTTMISATMHISLVVGLVLGAAVLWALIAYRRAFQGETSSATPDAAPGAAM